VHRDSSRPKSQAKHTEQARAFQGWFGLPRLPRKATTLGTLHTAGCEPVVGRWVLIIHNFRIHDKEKREGTSRFYTPSFQILIVNTTTHLGFSSKFGSMPSSSFPNATAPPQRAERAERVPDSAWEEHRETIKRLYIDSAMKLEVLVAHMEEHHGFTAR